jgi:subtilisin-like proprotein convertase family protein
MNFEHSYMGDLVITYICPNGQAIIVHQQGGVNEFLGEPIDSSLNDPAGIGYDYFWSPTASAGTWSAYATLNPNDTIIPSGTYNSVEPFSNLIGCPANGLWTIEICDVYGSDDGWLFNWGINFNSIAASTYDSIAWQGNDLLWENGLGNAYFSPTQYGPNDYSVSAILSNGCVLTDSITIQAVGPYIILTPEINACSLPIALNATVEGGNNNTIAWSYINEPTVLTQTDLLTTTVLSQPSSNIYVLSVTSDYLGGLQCSDTATVSVNLIEAIILQQPNSVDANIGDVVYFSCLASVGLSYQWQILVNGVWTNLNNTGQFSGVTTSQMSVSNVNMGNGNQQFQCVVASPDGACTEYSNSVTLYICDIASSSIPAVLNIALNTSPNISISPANNNASYQWQSNIGFGWVNISDGADYLGSTTANLTLINSDWLNDNQWLQCVVSTAICSDTTNICVVHITPTGIDETALGSIYYYENAMRFSQPSNAMGEHYYVFDGNGRLITEGKYFGENYIELNLQSSGVYCFRLKDEIIKFIKM